MKEKLQELKGRLENSVYILRMRLKKPLPKETHRALKELEDNHYLYMVFINEALSDPKKIPCVSLEDITAIEMHCAVVEKNSGQLLV